MLREAEEVAGELEDHEVAFALRAGRVISSAGLGDLKSALRLNSEALAYATANSRALDSREARFQQLGQSVRRCWLVANAGQLDEADRELHTLIAACRESALGRAEAFAASVAIVVAYRRGDVVAT